MLFKVKKKSYLLLLQNSVVPIFALSLLATILA